MEGIIFEEIIQKSRRNTDDLPHTSWSDDYEKKKVLQGRSDIPLNEAGIAEARAVGEWFRSHGIVFDQCYSSPLCRAVQTTELIAGYLDILKDERQTEMDYGPYEGMDLTKSCDDASVYMYCLAGTRPGRAVRFLQSVGYTNLQNIGGINAYKGPVEK